MKKEFGGKIIINNKQKLAIMQIDTDAKTLSVDIKSPWRLVFGDALIGYLANLTMDKMLNEQEFQIDLSSLKNAEFYRYGITSKAIKLDINGMEFGITCEHPKKMLELFKSLIN